MSHQSISAAEAGGPSNFSAGSDPELTRLDSAGDGPASEPDADDNDIVFSDESLAREARVAHLRAQRMTAVDAAAAIRAAEIAESKRTLAEMLAAKAISEQFYALKCVIEGLQIRVSRRDLAAALAENRQTFTPYDDELRPTPAELRDIRRGVKNALIIADHILRLTGLRLDHEPADAPDAAPANGAAEHAADIADLQQIIAGYDARRIELEQDLARRSRDIVVRDAKIIDVEKKLADETRYRRQSDASLAEAEAAREQLETELAEAREALAEQSLLIGAAHAALRRQGRSDAERAARAGGVVTL